MAMYDDWKARAMERSCEKVLKTVDHIIDEANGHLDSNELDDLKDCFKILHCIHCMSHHEETSAMAKKVV